LVCLQPPEQKLIAELINQKKMDWKQIIGLIAAACTTIAFLPQAIQIIRTKDTSSISAAMYIVFTVGTALWLVFGIYTKNTPVILANAVTSVFAAIILYYKLFVKPERSSK
jgi:MtN3 and saliva related transmembrane protein